MAIRRRPALQEKIFFLFFILFLQKRDGIFDVIKGKQRFPPEKNNISFLIKIRIKKINRFLNSGVVHIDIFFFLSAVGTVKIAIIGHEKG
jgi:hypothetical protein